MTEDSTLEEESQAPGADAVLLTFALSYDDLLGVEPRGFTIDDGARVELGRAAAGAPPGARAVGPGRIEIGDRRASGVHAVIARRGADALGPITLLEDLGSKNGSFVNGAPVRGKQRLVDGDRVEIGHALFVLRVVPRRLAAMLGADGAGVWLGPTRTWCAEVAALARDLSRIAPSSEPVLVLAETGAGKEVVARALHALSGRRGPLVSIDCGAIPEALFEATLFGHKKGAFTGASEARVGEIVRAHRGTLFLDEVANMSAAVQAKLLRVLEEGRVSQLGSTEPQLVDVRWIAATNGNILGAGSSFRRDLYARLAGFVGTLPPLRKRREDLGALTRHILDEAGVTRASITVAAGRRLFGARLEGNVRELRAVLRSAALLAAGEPIDLPHLAAVPSDAPGDAPEEAENGDRSRRARGGAGRIEGQRRARRRAPRRPRASAVPLRRALRSRCRVLPREGLSWAA